MSHACPECGKEFDNPKSKAAHMGHGHNKPWMDKQKLVAEYVENARATPELAEEWGCDPSTVRNWLERYEIDRREAKDYNRQEWVQFTHHEQGYERWMNYTRPDRGSSVFVHRLLAVAEYGTDAVANNHVHHKNGIPWDNRPDNIEIMSASDHAKQHYESGDLALEPGGVPQP